MAAGAGCVFEAHPTLPIVGVAKVEHGRVGAEWLAATPAWVGGLVGGDGLGSEPTVRAVVASLGGGGSWPLVGGAAAYASLCRDEGRAAGL